MSTDEITPVDIASTYLVLETIRDDYLDDPSNDVINSAHGYVQDLEQRVDDPLAGTTFDRDDIHVVTTQHDQTWLVSVEHKEGIRLEEDAVELVEEYIKHDPGNHDIYYRGTVSEFVDQEGINGTVLIE